MQAKEFLFESIWTNKNKVYKLLLDKIGSGPFDGGCVVVADALKLRYGGDVVVLVGRAQRTVKEDSAQHAALLLNGLMIDGDGALPPDQFVKRFTENELVAGGSITKIRPIQPNDLPDAPRDIELSKIISKFIR